MTPKELRDMCVSIYGDRGWQTRLAEELGVDGSTVRRWVSGSVPIPGPVSAAVRCLFLRSKT
jgi:hypothetical protein